MLGVRILVKAVKFALATQPFQDLAGMSSTAKRNIHVNPVGTDIQSLQTFPQHYRYMIGFHKRTSGDTAQMYELLGQMHGKTRELLPLPYKPSSI